MEGKAGRTVGGGSFQKPTIVVGHTWHRRRDSPATNDPLLVLRHAVPCGDEHDRMSALLAAVSYSTTSK